MSFRHHEIIAPEAPAPHSAKSFGLTIGLIALIPAAYFAYAEAFWTAGALAAVAAVLVGAALIAPAALAPLNAAWFRLGLLIARVMNPAMLGLIYFLVFVPIGLLVQQLNVLQFKRRPSAEASYWVPREAADAAEQSMKNQF